MDQAASEQQQTADAPAREVLTVDQAAELLQVSRAYFYRLLKRPDFPSGQRVGKRLRFTKRQLLTWIDQQGLRT